MKEVSLPHTYHFWCSSFVCVDPDFHVVTFPFCLKDFLQHSYNVGLPVIFFLFVLFFYVLEDFFAIFQVIALLRYKSHHTVHPFKVYNSATFHQPQKKSHTFFVAITLWGTPTRTPHTYLQS